jgi:hypothetical protein
MDFALKLSSFVLISIGLILLYAQIRAARKETLTMKSALLDSIGLVRGDIAASASFRTHRTITGLDRDKLQLLRTSQPIPDPADRRVVEVTRDSAIPSPSPAPSLEGAIVTVEFSPDQRFDSTGGRWLKQVVSASRSASQPTDDDTPAPPGQRAPMLPPQSTPPSGPRRSER